MLKKMQVKMVKHVNVAHDSALKRETQDSGIKRYILQVTNMHPFGINKVQMRTFECQAVVTSQCCTPKGTIFPLFWTVCKTM